MDIIDDSLKRNINFFLSNDFKICGIELTKHSELDTDFVVPHYTGFEYFGVTEKRDPKWYREHEEGWHLFNVGVKKIQN